MFVSINVKGMEFKGCQREYGTKLHHNKGVLDIGYWDTRVKVPIQVQAPLMGTRNMSMAGALHAKGRR